MIFEKYHLNCSSRCKIQVVQKITSSVKLRYYRGKGLDMFHVRGRVNSSKCEINYCYHQQTIECAFILPSSDVKKITRAGLMRNDLRQ